MSTLLLLTAVIAAFLGGIAYFQTQKKAFTFQRQGAAVVLQGDFSVNGTYLDRSGAAERQRGFRYSDVTLIEINEAYILIGRGEDAGRCIPRDRLIEFEWRPAPASTTPAAVATAVPNK